jgi:3-keto-5-aminohexanoate cleavage enzyme
VKTLPQIMVAPNGARRTKADHPALPVTVAETVEAAKACFAAGAGALHAHVRDAEQAHVLDAGLYSELIAEMARAVPDMDVQITTEAVGRYSPAEQRALVRDVRPKAVSVALKEMLAEGEEAEARRFYHWAAAEGIVVQHILYSEEDETRLFQLLRKGVIPDAPLQLLFVLGRYAKDQNSAPEDLDPFLEVLAKEEASAPRIEWAVCAFGVGETRCLEYAARKGGKARVGFENSLWNDDGSVAKDNAERVVEVAARIAAL